MFATQDVKVTPRKRQEHVDNDHHKLLWFMSVSTAILDLSDCAH